MITYEIYFYLEVYSSAHSHCNIEHQLLFVNVQNAQC